MFPFLHSEGNKPVFKVSLKIISYGLEIAEPPIFKYKSRKGYGKALHRFNC